MFSPLTFVRQHRSLPRIHTHLDTKTHIMQTHIHKHVYTQKHTHTDANTYICGSVPCVPHPAVDDGIILNSEYFDRRPKHQSAVCSSFWTMPIRICQYTKNNWRGGVNRAVLISFKSAVRHSLLFWCLCATS